MTVGQRDRPDLEGDLRVLDFLGEPLVTRVAPLYRELVHEYGQHNVLVLKRFPTGIDEITDALGDAIEGVETPRVRGLSAHARETIEELPSPPRLLSASQQGLLLTQFLSTFEWDHPYLQQAAEQDSFTSDVGRFVAEATWQGSSIDTDEAALAELASFNSAFHDWLADNDLLDPSAVLSWAADAMADPATRDRIQRSFDAVLVLEFEEFTPIDREYLARLTAGVDLVCLSEEDSAIQRTWNEPRRIEAYREGLRTDPVGPDGESWGEADPTSDEVTRPAAVAGLLATGERPTVTEQGTLTVIHEPTFDEHIRTVAEEIERLHRVENIPYDECAVILRDSNAPIPETLRLLRGAGIPTTSATVGGLEHDPAARELYALVCWCCDTAQEAGWDRDRAWNVLGARTTVSEESLEEVARIGADDGLEAALQRWLLESDLKHRLADRDSTVDAKTEFRHVSDVLQLARFIDESPLIDASWTLFAEALEREFTHATSDKIATELTLPDGGVVVDAVRVLKNVSKEAVFLVDLVDREYPAPPQFNALFPTPHLEQLPGYPAFTAPTREDVEQTFSTVRDDDDRRPLNAYYAELSRRMLAVGARVATDRLYFGTYDEQAGGTGSRHQPSRFLTPVEESLGEIDRRDDDAIHTHGETVSFTLSQVDDAMEAIRLAGVADEPVDLDAVEHDFGVIQALLDRDPPDDLRQAIETRTDFAAGVVRRE
ncbi:hypothetical protein ACFPYI_21765 [Halomarina salina]|uniref:Uncharacterized protein n=1 Tax=Halomarina salina TaxID=1872699 RepID=A0ABD5RTP5_9EURY|nr:hypothetical protein [Halomarina salina]